MNFEEIKKELVKQKDPLKYLEALLKKTTDKEIEKKIKIIIEKLKSFKTEEEPNVKPHHSNLEGLVRHAPRVAIEQDIIAQQIPRFETETISNDTLPAMALTVESKPSEDYGIRPGKKDYDISTERVKKSLQESNLVAEHGFTSSAETMHLVDQKMGEYNIDTQKSYIQGDQQKYQEFEHVQENVREKESGLTSLEKQVKKQKSDYK